MGRTVFVPLSHGDAVALQQAATASLWGVGGLATTSAMLAAHGFDESTLEDAEFAALSHAGVLALTSGPHDPLRLVLAVDLGEDEVSPRPGNDLGQVDVTQLRWGDVRALFTDEEAAAEAVTRAREQAAGRTLAEALELDAVQQLLSEHDLLWYAPEELDRLPQPPS